jgi:hypothetical protein
MLCGASIIAGGVTFTYREHYVQTLTGSPKFCVMTCRFSPDNISGARLLRAGRDRLAVLSRPICHAPTRIEERPRRGHP